MKSNANSFEILLTRLYELLEAERYSESTMRDMRFILHSMSNFMKINRLDDYSPEVGERFVAHCVNDLRICPSRISRAKNIAGKFDRLLQGLDGRDALLPDLTKRFELPDGLMIPLQEYYTAPQKRDTKTRRISYTKTMKKRTQYTAEYKTGVVLRVLREEETVSEIASSEGISSVMIGRWKAEFMERASMVFDRKPTEAEKELATEKEHTAELERKVGQLTIEVDWLKKKSAEVAARRAQIHGRKS